jgi:hypothetical protein
MSINVDAAAWDVVNAAGRMLDRWAESSEQVRNRDLWQPLHQAADRLRLELETSETAETLLAVYLAAATEDGSLEAAPDADLKAAYAAAALVTVHVQWETERRGGGRG